MKFIKQCFTLIELFVFIAILPFYLKYYYLVYPQARIYINFVLVLKYDIIIMDKKILLFLECFKMFNCLNYGIYIIGD